jgi:hypothetical protein
LTNWPSRPHDGFDDGRAVYQWDAAAIIVGLAIKYFPIFIYLTRAPMLAVERCLQVFAQYCDDCTDNLGHSRTKDCNWRPQLAFSLASTLPVHNGSGCRSAWLASGVTA